MSADEIKPYHTVRFLEDAPKYMQILRNERENEYEYEYMSSEFPLSCQEAGVRLVTLTCLL